MSKKHILVGPVIDYTLSDTLWRVRGLPPKKAFHSTEKLLKVGEPIWEYNVENLEKYSRGFLVNLFMPLSDRSPVDLSLKAPVEGIYQHGSYHDIFGRVAGSEYSLESAKKNNQTPKTLEELRNGKTESGDRTAHSFTAITSSTSSFTGAEIFRDFFDNLLSNSDPISEWIDKNANFTGNLKEFWESVESERKRLRNIECPMIPYNE